MLQLKSLQHQLEALEIALDQAIVSNKTFSEVKEIHSQMKDIKKLIYERKVMLKRDGLLS